MRNPGGFFLPKGFRAWNIKNPLWKGIKSNRIFGLLTIVKYLLKEIGSDIEWSKKIFNLLGKETFDMLTSMGFPYDWINHPLWGTAGALSSNKQQKIAIKDNTKEIITA